MLRHLVLFTTAHTGRTSALTSWHRGKKKKQHKFPSDSDQPELMEHLEVHLPSCGYYLPASSCCETLTRNCSVITHGSYKDVKMPLLGDTCGSTGHSSAALCSWEGTKVMDEALHTHVLWHLGRSLYRPAGGLSINKDFSCGLHPEHHGQQSWELWSSLGTSWRYLITVRCLAGDLCKQLSVPLMPMETFH